MISTNKCLAIIPARAGSKGLPNKNMRLLDGKPLIQYSIEAAINSKCISEIVVTTDSLEIASFSEKIGASVPFIRPDELASDHAKSIDVLQHAVKYYEEHFNQYYEHIMLLQPTSPLRNHRDITNAYQMFIENRADSLQSVSPTHIHPYLLRVFDGNNLFNYQENNKDHLRRQDLKECYVLNGAIYIVKRDILMIDNSMTGDKNSGYIMPKERSIDIDDEFDLKVAETFVKTLKYDECLQEEWNR